MVRLARQAPRRPVRKVLDPQIAQGLIDHARSVRRRPRPAHHFHIEGVGGHIDREAHGLLDATDVCDVERDVRHLARGDVDAADLAAGPEDDGRVVGRPAHRRIDAVDGPGLLQVAVETGIDRRLASALDVHHEQGRLVANAPDEGQTLAVGRRRRADRSARPAQKLLDLARLAIQPLDDIDLGVHVLGIFEHLARGVVVTEVQIATVRREGGFPGVLLLRAPRGELDTAAARAVIHPHLAGPQRPGRGEVFARHDELAVRRPVGRVQQTEALVRHLRRVRPVAVHDPDIVAAVTVGGEGDLRPVRRIFRLHVPGDAGCDGPRLAAADRHDVDVAQQVKDDLAAVRADVQRHPGAFGDVDGRVVRRARRVLYVPPGRLGLVFSSRQSGRRDRGFRRRRRSLGPPRTGHAQRHHDAQHHTHQHKTIPPPKGTATL